MAKIPHEALHHLFRDDTSLFTRAMRRMTGENLPDLIDVAEVNVDLTAIDAVERYADTILWLTAADGTEEFLVIEAQTEPPQIEKIRSWAWYLTFLENKYGIPASLLVVTPKEATVKAVNAQLTLGPERRPSVHLAPHLLGPHNTPLITDPELAAEDVVYAVYSLLAHRFDKDIERAMEPLLQALDTLPLNTARYYAEFVEGGLGEGCQREIWKQIMKTMSSRYVSPLWEEFRQEGRAQGREQGREEGRAIALADNVLVFLEQRKIRLLAAERDRITTCRDLDQLQAWLMKAPYIATADELFGELPTELKPNTRPGHEDDYFAERAEESRAARSDRPGKPLMQVLAEIDAQAKQANG